MKQAGRCCAWICVLFLSACGAGQTYSPPRPAGLPVEAVYAGGEDGGDWIACDGTPDNTLHCRIFDRRDGVLRYESWFRYCPRLGADEAGAPEMLDWEKGVQLGDVQLRRYRRDVFHPPGDATPADIALEEEQIQKYYRLDGVNEDCSPVADSDTPD